MKKITCIILSIFSLFTFALCGCDSYKTLPMSAASAVAETAVTADETKTETETVTESETEPLTETVTETKIQTTEPTTKKPKETTTKQAYNDGYGESDSKTVYITDTGEKYHSSGCQYLRKSKHAISISQAKSRGYTPCSKCRP